MVMTGPSGSGKSSLAFDTLFAEGQRRYMESLSAYARQFLDQMQKPDVDRIEGLSPAIAIEQRTSASNPRSTIATTTEIFDYLRVLYSSCGQPHHPKTGLPLKRLSAQEIVDILASHPSGTKVILLAPVVRKEKGEFRDVLEKLKREGFLRARINGELHDIEQAPKLDKNKRHSIEAVVDRLILGEGVRTRLTDSTELALARGSGVLRALCKRPEGEQYEERAFSNQNFDPQSGESFSDLTPRHFSFNSPLGACPRCHGLGSMLVLDEGLVVQDPDRSLDNGVIVPWRRANKPMMAYYKALLRAVAKHYKAPCDKPWKDLDMAFRRIVLHGSGDEPVPMPMRREGHDPSDLKPFEGVMPQLARLYEESESELTRKKIEAYMSRLPCTACGGSRFKAEILAVTLGGPLIAETGGPKGVSIRDACALSVDQARDFFSSLALEPANKIASDVLGEILKRLQFLHDVGLGYLSLNRESGTLSGGEAQRIRLATQIGAGLTSVLYILDEPSIGLHQRDNERLIGTLKQLRDLGNSVLVVEHDEETIRAADHIVDLGPGAGIRGGQVVAQGSLHEILASPASVTGQFMDGRRCISLPKRRERGTGGCITIRGARANNLKNIEAKFPLGTLTCVTGVSGSGKSTLVNDILSKALFRHFYGSKDRPGEHDTILGLDEIDKVIEIDQHSIGRTPRSNPVSYVGAFNAIRDLFAGLPASRVRGYSASRFSFNVKGGRCETCEGEGLIRIPMHFLPDVRVTCESCGGRRFNRETLEVTYKGKNISDILDMTVDAGLDFFRPVPQVRDKLSTLSEVGLGYLRLGQPSDTLSGGEAQRVKLALELSKKQTGRTLYLLDEPTTGLHFADVELLVSLLLRLREAGNTVVVIEHNLDVIKCADHILDLGPEGGSGGGTLVACGTPEQIAAHPRSHTGRFLAETLRKHTSKKTA